MYRSTSSAERLLGAELHLNLFSGSFPVLLQYSSFSLNSRDHVLTKLILFFTFSGFVHILTRSLNSPLKAEMLMKT